LASEPIVSPQESALPRSRTISLPWHRAALGAILALTAVLDFFQLDRVGLGNTYYAAAVRSMLTSWHNFFFVSLDSGGFVSIDKPPVAFWLQAASAKVFGFSGIALLLPEALAGVVSVLLLYFVVARSFGQPAGLLASLALAVTPVAVLVNRSNLIESVLVLTLLLAAWAVLRATEAGRLRWLLLSALLVGIGFNVKMLEAYLVVPALFLVYLAGAPVAWPTRAWHLLLAGLVLMTVSLSWVLAVDLTPVSQRPYVGSSGNNSELSLALGYNGLGRLTGNSFAFLNGGTSLSKTITDLSPTSLGFTRGETGGAGIERLVNAELGGQTGWLIMLAIIGFVVVASRGVRLPLDRRQQQLVLWGIWLLTGGLFFSIAGFFHAYYLDTIAPPVAALAGIGIVTLWQDYRSPGWRGWILPLALVASALVQGHILNYFPDWSRWLTPLVVGGSVLLAIILILSRVNQRTPRSISPLTVGVGVLVLFLAPSTWTEYTVAHASGNMVPSAGPGGRGGFGFAGGPARFAGGSRYSLRPGGFRYLPAGAPGFGPPPGGASGPGFPPPAGAGLAGPGGAPGDDRMTANKNLVRYLETRQGRSRFLLATLDAGTAEPFILTTGKPVMDLGGFMGADRILTATQLSEDVSNGTVRFFLLPARGPGRGGNLPARPRAYIARPGPFRAGFARRFRTGFFGGPGGNANNDLVQWVDKNCSAVPASAYHSVSAVSEGFRGGQQLYDCGAIASRAGS